MSKRTAYSLIAIVFLIVFAFLLIRVVNQQTAGQTAGLRELTSRDENYYRTQVVATLTFEASTP